MEDLFFYIFLAGVVFVSLTFLLLAHMFHQEGENSAKQKAILVAIITLIIGYISFELRLEYVLYFTLILLIAFLTLLFFPFKVNKDLTDDVPKEQYDERDIMFSRKELIPGSEKYKSYYDKYPERESLDNKFRAEPGLLSDKSAYFHKEAFRQANESFAKIDPLYTYIEGNVNPRKMKISAMEFTEMVKSRAKSLGALEVGITLTRPYHFYSHKGRRHEYGNEIKNSHQFAIAFTVEMDYDMVMAAPKASIVAESAKQYLNAGIIATQLTEFIRTLGYKARPHIDGNYQVVCPLVARDAGLGEIGRMGLLMTKKHGPRVRIGVITTELELIPDNWEKNHSVIEFCRLCKKCADCCPSQSISHEDPLLHDGVKRWKIDSESCFTFWSQAGTDCGRCMAVCPYSHSNHSLHKIIRWGIQHSKFARYLAIQLDDLFYGKKPISKPMPKEIKR